MELFNFQPFQSSYSRWRAVTQRDASAHCSFLYGVTSTKIYCRPTCSARLARRANVVFYDSIDQARRNGYRPCQRCKPDDHQFFGEREEIVIRALALLKTKHDTASMQGGLKQLSKEVGVTPSYLCRVFKKTMGMTIGAYIKDFEAPATPRTSAGSEVTDSSFRTSTADSQPAGEASRSMVPDVNAMMNTAGAEYPWQSPDSTTFAGRNYDMAFAAPQTVMWSDSNNSMMSGLDTGSSTIGLPRSSDTTGTLPPTTESSGMALFDPAFPTFQDLYEPLDLDFDQNHWLWIEGFDFNNWVTSTQFDNLDQAA